MKTIKRTATVAITVLKGWQKNSQCSLHQRRHWTNPSKMKNQRLSGLVSVQRQCRSPQRGLNPGLQTAAKV
jgi:hypothetical protein